MKKQLLLFVLFLMFTQIVNAVTFKYNGIRYTILSESLKTVEVASSNQSAGSDGGASYSGDIQIPSTVYYNGNGYSVIGIGESAFVNCVGISSVSLPNTLTYIGKEAFSVCMGLKKITIPSKVESIGYDVFGVTSVSEIVVENPIPADVAYNAFYYPQANNNCVLYVPYGTSNAYRNAAEWKKFKTIKESAPKPESIAGHEYVDLGLPSGRLWATQNYGATSETQYGNYVYWKSTDLITANWGSDWGTPSSSDYQELLSSCTWSWGSKGGVYGYSVTGPNGSSIFFPAAGFKLMDYPQMVGSGIYYWTITPSYESGFAFMLSGNSSSLTANVTFNTELMSGPIRPIVKSKTNGIDNLKLENSPSIIYDLNGQVRDQVQKGVNIIRLKSGKTKKYVIK